MNEKQMRKKRWDKRVKSYAVWRGKQTKEQIRKAAKSGKSYCAWRKKETEQFFKKNMKGKSVMFRFDEEGE